MGRTKYPGKGFYRFSDKVERTIVSFKQICEHSIMQKIIKPPHQGELQDNRIDEMISEYCVHPEYWLNKQIVTVSILNDSYFITDGQHRIEAAKKLYLEHNYCNETDHFLIFNWFTVETEDEMRDLFKSVNKDSTKNELFVTQDIIIQARAEKFVKFFKSNYGPIFPKKSNKYRYQIESFRDELLKIGLFSKEHYNEANICSDINNDEDVEHYILRSAGEYFKLYDYNRYITQNQLEYLFYADEVKFIKDHNVFMLKHNNFIEWIASNKTIRPKHNTKPPPRKTIPVSVKNIIWKREYGENENGKCPITLCDNIIKKDINNNWHCGHVISHHNGGKMSEDNLRPICIACNLDMSSTNWVEYEERLQQFK